MSDEFEKALIDRMRLIKIIEKYWNQNRIMREALEKYANQASWKNWQDFNADTGYEAAAIALEKCKEVTISEQLHNEMVQKQVEE